MLLAVLAVSGATALTPAQASAVRGITPAMIDDSFASADGAVRNLWLGKARAIGARYAQYGASWAGIAPAAAHRPTGFNAANPADPHYDWGTLDAQIRSARSNGIAPVILVTGGAPAWAEGAHRPSTSIALAGTWKPNPKALGEFGKAIAKRYSGSYDAPGDGIGTLPRVRYFQLWAEANLSVYLTPQFKRGKLIAAGHYRKMLNSFYRGVHLRSPKAKVLTSGLAPYGDLIPNGQRSQPVNFWRTMLCLRGKDLATTRCPDPARFDIAAHNPINVGSPFRHARNGGDVSTPDFGRLRKIIRRAKQTRRLYPLRNKPFWSTEIWWDSRPPDPKGLPLRTQARYVAEQFYVLWRQRVAVSFWFHLRDPDTTDYGGTQQSGLYRLGGQPKPALSAYRFPFVAHRLGGSRVQLWGLAPPRAAVVIERKQGSSWRRLRTLRAGSNRVFRRTISLPRSPKLRARAAGQTSLTYKVR